MHVVLVVQASLIRRKSRFDSWCAYCDVTRAWFQGSACEADYMGSNPIRHLFWPVLRISGVGSTKPDGKGSTPLQAIEAAFV